MFFKGIIDVSSTFVSITVVATINNINGYLIVAVSNSSADTKNLPTA